MNRFAGVIGVLGLLVTAGCAPTDDGITTKVRTDLAADAVVNPNDVNVTTRNKVVTLTGNVGSAAAKTQAVRIAHQIDGVRDVIDRLRVSDTAATSGRAETGIP